jgi:hypothetical protein
MSVLCALNYELDEPFEPRDGERHTMPAARVSANRALSRTRRRKRAAQAVLRSTIQRLDSRTKPLFAAGRFREAMAGGDNPQWPPPAPQDILRPAAAPPRRHGPWLPIRRPSARIGSGGTPLARAADQGASCATPHPPGPSNTGYGRPRAGCAAAGGICGHEDQIGGDQGSYLITDLTGVGFAFHRTV